MDDMYPNDGAYFLPREPEERVRQREVAKSKAHANKDIIHDVIERLEQRITFYHRIDSIPADILNDPESVGFHIAANTQTIANLQLEIDHWKGVLKSL